MKAYVRYNKDHSRMYIKIEGYNAKWIEKFKALVDADSRNWSPNRREWDCDSAYCRRVLRLLESYFTVVERKPKPKKEKDEPEVISPQRDQDEPIPGTGSRPYAGHIPFSNAAKESLFDTLMKGMTDNLQAETQIPNWIWSKRPPHDEADSMRFYPGTTTPIQGRYRPDLGEVAEPPSTEEEWRALTTKLGELERDLAYERTRTSTAIKTIATLKQEIITLQTENRLLRQKIANMHLNQEAAAFDRFARQYGGPTASASANSPYAVLGLREDAPIEVIEAAWKARIGKVHPDRPGGDTAEAQKVNNAHDQILSQRGVKR